MLSVAVALVLKGRAVVRKYLTHTARKKVVFDRVIFTAFKNGKVEIHS